MATIGKLFVQMAESIRKATEQLSNMNRSASYSDSCDILLHQNTNKVFSPPYLTSSPI